MDQLDYASKMANCKKTFASNPLNVAQMESKTSQQRDLYIQERCREQVNVQLEKEKTQSQQNNQVKTDKSKLPTSKDPTLAKKQAEAEIQKKKGELENKLQQEKEKKVEELKSKIATLTGLAIGGVGLFPKLPMIDPKIIATLQFLKAQKESIEVKQRESKENVAKAKENFTFPMKPVKNSAVEQSTSQSSMTVADIPTKSPSSN